MTTLRQKMKHEMILRGYSLSTQDVYLRSVVKLHDHFNRNPAELTEEEIKEFLLFTLANKSSSSIKSEGKLIQIIRQIFVTDTTVQRSY